MTRRIGRPVATIVLTSEEEQKLRLMARRPSAKQQDALRARIILGCAQGLTNTKLAQQERVCLPTVGKWRTRFAKDRLAALADAPRTGAPRQITDAKVEEVVTRTLESTPPGCTHWSSRKMARTTNISEHSVLRIWHAFGLKPHLSKSFQTFDRSDVRRKGA